MTNEQRLEMRKIAEEQREKQQALAKAKKDRMIKIEEEKLKSKEPENEFEIEESQNRTALQKKAKRMVDENLDEVKYMSQLVNYAKVATVRDKQLEEKKFIHSKRVQEQKRQTHQKFR